MPAAAVDCQLSRTEIERFHEEGYLGPYTLCSREEMAAIRARIENEVLTTDGPNPKTRIQARYLDNRLIYDLCSHPAIVERMNSLMGPDLVLWASYFFTKNPGDKEIPWHQDLNYWPMDPPLNLSAWLAIDDSTVENSCVRVIPKSHKKVLKHVKSTEGMGFSEMADPQGFDAGQAVNMELEAGQFFLFSERMLHQSNANSSNKRRMGMTVRVTVPFVKLTHDIPPLFPGHAAMLIRGEDRHGLNRLAQPPL